MAEPTSAEGHIMLPIKPSNSSHALKRKQTWVLEKDLILHHHSGILPKEHTE